MNFRTHIITLLASASLLLTACGGGGGSGGGGNTGSDDLQTAVRLSGTLAIDNGNTSPRLAARGVAHRSGSAPTDLIIIIAVDGNGNSYTTMSDRSGDFEFADDEGLKSNTPYALVFIDTSTLEVIASLVTGTGGVGMLSLDGDTTLDEILIDPDNTEATLEGTNTGVEVVDGSSLDDDGDGVITQDDINAAQVEAVNTGGTTAIESMSVVTFFGEVNTWSLEMDESDDTWENDACWYLDATLDATEWTSSGCDIGTPNMFELSAVDGEFSVIVPAQVEGPAGDQVNASKRIEFTYYNQDVPVDGSDTNYLLALSGTYWNTWNDGYASGSQADINDAATMWGSAAGVNGEYFSPYLDAALGAVPSVPYSQQMGLWGWSDYRYVDVENGVMLQGEKRKDSDTGVISIDWEGFALPLNLPLNTDVSINESRTKTFFDPVAGADVQVTIATEQVINVKLVTEANGSPALVTETGANPDSLPVIQVNMAIQNWSITGPGINFNQDTNPALLPPEIADIADDFDQGCFYVVAKYGIEADDPDQNCTDMSDWQDGFENQRFGEIMVDASGTVTGITDRTATFITAQDTNDASTGLPVTGAAGPITTQAENWLAYTHANASKMDYVFEPFDFADGSNFGNTAEFWTWVDWPFEGSALTPQPWGDQSTAPTLFEMGTAPGTITLDKVHYMATGTAGAQFYMDLRVWDPVTDTQVTILSAPIAATAVDHVTQNAAPVDTATTEEQIIDLSVNFSDNLPPAGNSAWDDSWESFEDPDGDQTFDLYNTSWVTVWYIMDVDINDDGTIESAEGRQEYPVDSYRAYDPTPIPQQ
ncbi:MAG: hypothetical protein QNJ69_01125 [Gammaproteobacteria bacterium]|nr:hypothetical protein [Gammaproteobacteria bacterium]